MVTTAASAWMSSIPDRMPAMLQPEEMQEWLARTGRLGFPALRREAGGHRARARGWVSGWWCAAGGVVPVRGFPCYYRIVVNVVFQFKQFSGTGYAHICGDGAAPITTGNRSFWDEVTHTGALRSRLRQSWRTPTPFVPTVLVELLRELANSELFRPLRPVAAVRIFEAHRFAVLDRIAP